MMAIHLNETATGAKSGAFRRGALSSLNLKTLLFRCALFLTLLLATGLRFYHLAGQSFWSDEGNSVALAKASLAEITARTALDIHPPLYYWLLHGWMQVFGDSEVAVRSLSAVAGVLLVALIYRLGARLFGAWAGLLAAFIAALSPFQIYYAQEARMYALLTLVGAMAVWATLELVMQLASDDDQAHRGQPAGPGEGTIPYSVPVVIVALTYVIAVTLGLYTHYAFPVILLATNAAVLIYLWRKRSDIQVGRLIVGWFVLQVVPLILYLPWLPIAWRQLTGWPAPSVTRADNALISVWRNLVLGPIAGESAQAWLLGFGLLGLLGSLRFTRKIMLPIAVLFLLYLGLPIGLTLALFKPAYLKFLLIASPALCLLLAAGLTGDDSRLGIAWGGGLVAGLVAVAAWGPLSAYYSDPAVARNDYRGMARYLEAVAGPHDAIILNAAGQQEVFGYYYRGDAPVYPLPRRRPLDPEATVAELRTILARSGRIFALYWATDESDPSGLIEGWLEQHAFKATDAWVGDVRLVSYAAPIAAGELTPANISFGEHVTLIGYQLLCPAGEGKADANCASAPTFSGIPTGSFMPGEIVQIQLRWQSDARLNTRYVVFVQALDSANHLVGQRDGEPAVPTLDWQAGQSVLDHHGLLIEPGTPPGEYRVIAGLYDPTTGQRLLTTGGDFVELGTLRVERPLAPPPAAALRFQHAASVNFGPLRLLGYDRYLLGHSYDADAPLRPSDALHVVLYWQATSRPEQDWQVALQLVSSAGTGAPVSQSVHPAAGVNYPAGDWGAGEMVRAQFDLWVPNDAAAGTYGVRVRLLDEAGAPARDAFSLLPIKVD
jgi:mannosyltransferase